MTLAAPTFPLSESDAVTHLRDALGANYGGPTDGDTLTRALTVDGVVVEAAFHPRPWATAARLIRDNTEYEVGGTLAARVDRKLVGLAAQQRQMDLLAGVYHLLPGLEDDWAAPVSGSVPVEAVW